MIILWKVITFWVFLLQTKNSLVLKFCQLTSIYITSSQQKETIKICILSFSMPPSIIKKDALLYIYSWYYFLLLLIIKFFFQMTTMAKEKNCQEHQEEQLWSRIKYWESWQNWTSSWLICSHSNNQASLWSLIRCEVLKGKTHNLEMNLKR